MAKQITRSPTRLRDASPGDVLRLEVPGAGEMVVRIMRLHGRMKDGKILPATVTGAVARQWTGEETGPRFSIEGGDLPVKLLDNYRSEDRSDDLYEPVL